MQPEKGCERDKDPACGTTGNAFGAAWEAAQAQAHIVIAARPPALGPKPTENQLPNWAPVSSFENHGGEPLLSLPLSHRVRVLCRCLVVAADGDNIGIDFDSVHKIVQMGGIAQLDTDEQAIEIGFAIGEHKIRDIRAGISNQCANAPQNTCVVADRHR